MTPTPFIFVPGVVPPLRTPTIPAERLREQVAVNESINKVMPHLTALAQTLESHVLTAACVVLAQEQAAIRAQWSGQVV